MRACNHYVYITATALECYRDLPGGLALTASISTPRNMSADRDSHEVSVRQFESHLDQYPRDRYFVIQIVSGAILVALGLLLFFHRDWWLHVALNRALDGIGLTSP